MRIAAPLLPSWSRLLSGLAAVALPAALAAAQPFPAGSPQELYLCPRIDLLPAAAGGPLAVVLDGRLDDEAWQRARWETQMNLFGDAALITGPDDLVPRWAAVCDADHVYVAWKVVDSTRCTANPNLWDQDTVEVYFDMSGDGQACGAVCDPYQIDDLQMLVPAKNVGAEDPDELAVAVSIGTGSLSPPEGAPFVDSVTGETLIRGVVRELDSPDGLPGWQGEIAIPFAMADARTYAVDPVEGTVLGFEIAFDDQDDCTPTTQENSAMFWAKDDVGGKAFHDVCIFRPLRIIEPPRHIIEVTRTMPAGLRNGGTGTVTITVKPVMGTGPVKVHEVLPPTLTPGDPSAGGKATGNAVDWDLGTVTEEIALTYTVTVAADAVDVELAGTAEVLGQEFPIAGDTAYTGSPFTLAGFIKLWDHLGPLAVGGDACALGDGLKADWIVDARGSGTEMAIDPFPGLLAEPKYGGDGVVPGGTGARAAGLVLAGNKTSKVDFPAWKSALSPSDTIDHAAVHGFTAVEDVTLSSIYVTNHLKETIETSIGVASSDLIAVYLDGDEVGEFLGCRDSWGCPGEEQDTFPVRLRAGESRLLVKVANGAGSGGFRLRFQDPAGPDRPGLMPPAITASLESAARPPPARVVRSLDAVFPPGGPVPVTLTVTAAGPVDVDLREVLPAFVAPGDIPEGGTAAGSAIRWSLKGVTAKTFTYTLVPAPCLSAIAFGQSTWTAGDVEALIDGPAAIAAGAIEDGPIAPWEVADIGCDGGRSRPLGPHSVVVVGPGGGVAGKSDGCRFIHRPASGDFQVTAKVDCLSGGPGYGGLMVRGDEDPGSATAFFAVTSSTTDAAMLKITVRKDGGLTATALGFSAFRVASLPVWLRIVREGTKLSFQRAYDGAAYAELAKRDIGTNLLLGADTRVGLAATGNGSEPARYAFLEVDGPEFGPSGPRFRRGDVDASGEVDLTDVITLLTRLFLGGDEPPCSEAGDADDSGELDLTDAIYSLAYQFLGGSPPADPFGACGTDPTPDGIGCRVSCP